MSPGEIGAQPLARLQLLRFDQGMAVATAAAGQPSQQTFRLVDRDRGAASVGRYLFMRQIEVLAAKRFDVRRRGFRGVGGGFSGHSTDGHKANLLGRTIYLARRAAGSNQNRNYVQYARIISKSARRLFRPAAALLAEPHLLG
jgi:hypothetical protein